MYLFERLRRAIHNMFIQVGVTWPDTQVIEAFKHMPKKTSLSIDTRKKEGFSKPVYLHRALHGQDHHLGGKSLIDVEIYVKPVGGGGVVVWNSN